MGDIFKFIVDNFNRLTPIDFFFLGTLLVLSSLGIFFTLRWIFGALIKSQQQLIQIKEETIQAYQKNLDQNREESAYLQQKLVELDSSFQFLSAEHNQTIEEREAIHRAYSRLYSNSLSMRVALNAIWRAYIQLRIFENARAFLVIYAELNINQLYPEAPPPYIINNRLSSFEEKIYSPFNGIQSLIHERPEQLLEELQIPAQLSQMNCTEVESQIDVLRNQMGILVDRYFKEHPAAS